MTKTKNASVIILNWNGRDLLVDCIPSVIEAIRYDGGEHELMVVDNGSKDGSIEFIRDKFPSLKLIPLSKNKRFAGANNIAAYESKNDILIFLNNDVIVDKGFIRTLLRHFDDERIFAVGSKIIMPTQWAGNIKIKETGLTRGIFMRGNLDVWQENTNINCNVPILYASGSAMACDKKKFFQLKGFDMLYNPFYYEDTDLSYRAWKKGWKVIYEPESIVYHKYRATNNPSNFHPDFIRRSLEKNKILFVWKNISDFNYLFQHIFFLGLRLLRAFFPLDAHYIFSFFCALNQLPDVIVRRLRGAKRGNISDKRIFELIREADTLYKKVGDFRGQKRRKILVLGNAPLPFENQKKVYGLNIRTWNTIRPLCNDGHKIVLIASRIKGAYENGKFLPRVIRSEKEGFVYYSVEEELFNSLNFLQSIYNEFLPDCVIGVNTQPASKAVLLKTDKPIWADLNGSLLAEAQAKAYVYDNNTYLGDFWHYENTVLKKADIFSVVSLPQKFALIGELAMLGRLNKFTFGYDFIHYIPNSIDDNEYRYEKNVLRNIAVKEDDFVILWSGGYNTWTDIDTLFLALESAMQDNVRIKFISIGGAIEGHDEKTYARFLSKISFSSFSGRFIFKDWVPAKDVPNYYFESDIGINIDKFNYETLLGARNRLLDMLKAGLPVLTSLGTEISYLIQREKLGFTYPIGNQEELAKIILFLAENKKLLKECGQKAKEYVFQNLTSEQVAHPLKEWVKNPQFSPDKGKPPILFKHRRKSKFKRYLRYVRTEGFSIANKRVYNFLLNRFKSNNINLWT